MAIRSVIDAIQDMFTSWYEAIMGEKRIKRHYIRYLFIILGIAGLATGSFFGYRWYVMYRERSAYKALTEYLDDYRHARSEQDADWAPIEDLFKLGYEQHSNSYLAPFFLAFESDALIQQNKKTEAAQVLDGMIAKSSNKDPLLPLFKTKRALLKLDLQDKAAQESGLEELVELGNDTQNIFNDVALYYLGQYYWSENKLDDAKHTWQQLVDQQKHEKIMGSPWAQLAQQKLDQIA